VRGSFKIGVGKALRQHNLGRWLGFSYSQTFNTMAYFNIFMGGINLLTFWHTTMVQTRPDYLAWISLPIFIGFVFMGFWFVGFMDYKFVMPARVAFSNRQFFRHDNPLLAELARQREIERRIADKLGIDISDLDEHD